MKVPLYSRKTKQTCGTWILIPGRIGILTAKDPKETPTEPPQPLHTNNAESAS